jgi:hypothetical protein
MPSIISLVSKLKVDFPQFRFTAEKKFQWSPSEMTIYFEETSADAATLLHELAHAILDHRQYSRDIQLIKFEQAAWQYAQATLSKRYAVAINQDDIDTSLDTYRDWLHARSQCPHCKATGLQIKSHLYSCLACTTKWRVNDARVCELRRVVIA